jgi:hypothetical protein
MTAWTYNIYIHALHSYIITLACFNITGQCVCYADYAGEDCGNNKMEPPTVSVSSPESTCDLSKGSCTSLYLYGDGLYSSDGMACRFQPAEVSYTLYFVTRLTRRVSIVVQELLTIPEHLSLAPVFSGVRVTRSLVLCVCFVDHCLSFCPFCFWPLCCLSFDLPLWYLQTLLIPKVIIKLNWSFVILYRW